MSIAPDQITALFSRLRRSDAIPEPRSLSQLLTARLQTGGPVRLNDGEATLFMTAAIDMWHRSVHSFILSVALTRVSILWSSVSGYYASHYSVRALAHLHGFFAVFHRRTFLEMSFAGGRYNCNPANISHNQRREHQFYWSAVNGLLPFGDAGIFPANLETNLRADVSHRNHANYADHLNRLTRIDNVSADELRDRIVHVASTALEGQADQPDRDRFPDLASVMNLAYLRIYYFREYLDGLLPPRNPFWRAARETAWFMNVMRFPPRPATGIQTA
jgi:hypothetical protein